MKCGDDCQLYKMRLRPVCMRSGLRDFTPGRVPFPIMIGDECKFGIPKKGAQMKLSLEGD